MALAEDGLRVDEGHVRLQTWCLCPVEHADNLSSLAGLEPGDHRRGGDGRVLRRWADGRVPQGAVSGGGGGGRSLEAADGGLAHDPERPGSSSIS